MSFRGVMIEDDEPICFHPPKPQQGLKQLPTAQIGFETARHLGYLLTQRYVCHLRTALAPVGHSATRVLPEHVLEGLLITSSAGSFKNCNPNLPPTKREMMIEDDSILLLGPKDENLYASWSSKWPLQIPWSLLKIRGVLPESLGDQLGKVGKRIHGTRCDPKLRGQLPGVYLRTQSHHRLKWVAKKTWDPKNFVAILQNLPIIWFSSVVCRKNGKHAVLLFYILLLKLGRQYKTSVETLLWLITFWNHQFSSTGHEVVLFAELGVWLWLKLPTTNSAWAGFRWREEP